MALLHISADILKMSICSHSEHMLLVTRGDFFYISPDLLNIPGLHTMLNKMINATKISHIVYRVKLGGIFH